MCVACARASAHSTAPHLSRPQLLCQSARSLHSQLSPPCSDLRARPGLLPSYFMLPTQHLCDALRLLPSESKYSPSGQVGGSLAEIATPGVTAPGFDWRSSKASFTQPSGRPQLRLFLDCGSRICQNSSSHKWRMAPTPRSSSQSESLGGPSGTVLRLWRRKHGQHICSAGRFLPRSTLCPQPHSIEWMSV